MYEQRKNCSILRGFKSSHGIELKAYVCLTNKSFLSWDSKPLFILNKTFLSTEWLFTASLKE